MPTENEKSPQQDRMSHEEAAKYLGVSPGTLRVWRCTRRYLIPYYRIGNRIQYSRAELDAWLDSRRVD